MAGSRVGECVNAAVDALRVYAPLLSTLGAAKVYTHVPQNTEAPYVLVMGGDEIPWAVSFDDGDDDGDNGGRQVDVRAMCVSKYRGSAQVDALADGVMEVLTTASTWSGLTRIQLGEFVRNEAPPPTDASSDGTMWFQRIVTVRVTLG